ncbi:MAG: hypothetical protein AAF458_11045 [Pseudomonadota bacterium]
MTDQCNSADAAVDEVRGDTTQPAGATLGALLIASLIAWVGYPHALVNWLNGFPVHPVVEWTISQADSVALWIESIQLDELHRQIRAWIGAAREL